MKRKFKIGDKVLVPEWDSRNEKTFFPGFGYIIAETEDGYLVLSIYGYLPVLKKEEELIGVKQ